MADGNRTAATIAIVEGATVFENTFVKSVETEITLDRKFSIPGYTYNLTLIRYHQQHIITYTT
jgi:hypothetical protein